MHIQRILRTHLITDLTDRLDERLGLDITDRASDLGNYDIRIGSLTYVINKLFNLISNMRNDLNRLTQVLAFSLLGDDIRVHLTRGDVREAV